uniref:NAD(P)(+)--arginine ADP-ribosyltransferase n=1 Tax=Cryptomonas curvata TaxID=233186 RepID=A0A7S0MKL6_9CRYP|mmetsp:Transcript_44622/g.93381  ORF Transcript_44622/g.93381 Transcript_44622/m.93381 type:complete len:189 (+) Transcript_44622:173-739(+)
MSDRGKREKSVFAIVMYTFDLSLIAPAAPKENNFYFRLNQMLRERDAEKMKRCAAYMHYLLYGLEALQPFACRPDAHLWRGVSREGREMVLKNYIRGRTVHWSGFSSASPSREVAAGFAGPGGVLLRLDLLHDGSRARDIRALSAIPSEQEVLLLPNFALFVTNVLQPLDGLDTIELVEMSGEHSHFF